ncbi:MAG: excinuclease ABC subunit UvrC [Synergistota bacterium]|jgi:excinuclease ABC subunit C|nr:excinuclease ABC subunit UvrC [Synergistota bacterium]OPZ41105.1 MAG: UvrABC system protein C [Synergistetes bacterium ADurb.BinA166]
MAREHIKNLLKSLPDRPGVYLMRDGEGGVLYVGKAKSLKKRVASYFRHDSFASPRLRKLVSMIEDISVIRTETEVEALILEAKLIKKYAPFFNVDLKMNDRYPYIKITSETFPRIVITRQRGKDDGIYFGPYVRVGDVRSLLRLIERYLPLRICAREIDPGDAAKGVRPCLHYSLGRCMGVCAGLASASEYRERVDDVILLLQGQSAEVVERLRKRMDSAAREMRFEEAARLRDTIRAIWRVSRQRLSMPLREDFDGDMWIRLNHLQELLNLPVLPWRIDGFDISHMSGRETYGVVVVFEQGVPNRSLYRRFKIRTVEGVDDFRSMEETLERRYSRSLEGKEPLPQLILIDGGPVQLEFARKALAKLGLEKTPSISLAKEEELIYHSSEGTPPLRLDRGDDALRLLQSVRDEAHRFAIESHRSARTSRLRRSALEDIPGIGKHRAAQLLGRFGSASAIAGMTIEELSGAPGIGAATAARILDYLKGRGTDEDN